MGGIRLDTAATDRIQRVGRALTDRIDDFPVTCRFRLLQSPQKNAYSLSCGCIYITRGLYDQLATDDLLAATLAHELAHVAGRDGRKPCLSPQVQLQREIIADRTAVNLLNGSGYRPRSMLTIVKLLEDEQPPGWASRRLAQLRELVPPTQASDPQPLVHHATSRPH